MKPSRRSRQSSVRTVSSSARASSRLCQGRPRVQDGEREVAVAFLAVAATTAYVYDVAWTTDSSTAGLFLAFQPFQGFLIVVIASGLDMLFGELPAWRRRRKSESAGR